jgi:hypothetical protein
MTIVTVALTILLAGPLFGGIWFYFAWHLPPIAAWIGVAVYAVFVIALVMHLSWISTFWPEHWKRAFDKVITCLGHANWPV